MIGLLALGSALAQEAELEEAPEAPEVQVLEAGFPVQMHRLDNGLEVWLQPRDGQAFAALLAVRGGGRYESLEESGASHLLEHMLFTGTERWPDEKQLRRFVEERGGSFNGHTHDETVRYRVFLPSRHRVEALEWLEQVVYHPILSQEQLDKEREVVFEERGGRDGWWMRQLYAAGFDQWIFLEAQRRMGPQLVAHLLMIALILAGNAVYFVTRRRGGAR